jgi:serine O-acetyltransferase
VTIGLRQGDIEAPKLGNNVFVGTGAKLLGPIQIGSGANIGAHAVVIHDVEPSISVVGVPARPIRKPLY